MRIARDMLQFVGVPAPRPWASPIVKLAPVLCWLACASCQPTIAHAQTQVTAHVQAGATPVWDKGILPISSESYYHAIECGKQGGKSPPCVFWDVGLCKNDDFALSMYTPYKMVAYEVWRVVSKGGSPPHPNYQEAQRTRVTVGVAPVPGAKNPIAAVVVKRDGGTVEPTSRVMEGAGGRFTFDPAAFSASGDITLELVGKTRTISCVIPQAVLTVFR